MVAGGAGKRIRERGHAAPPGRGHGGQGPEDGRERGDLDRDLEGPAARGSGDEDRLFCLEHGSRSGAQDGIGGQHAT